MHNIGRNRQQGQVFIVVALALVMLVGAVGLAVDSGMGYLIKAKLNAAADAASVAGARAATLGANRGEQRAQAIAAAEKFFAANYPPNYLGSQVRITRIEVGFDQPRPGRITVDVGAHATVPVSFMGVMGFSLLDIRADAQTIRKDLDLAFVVDTSGSMQSAGPEVRKQAAAFLDRFSPSGDRVALAHFSNGAEVDVPIRTGRDRGYDRERMQRIIGAYDFAGLTNSAYGFWHGRNQLNRVGTGDRSSMRVIVFFSDGSPNTFASRFRFRHPLACARAGAISTNDTDDEGIPYGLWDHTRQQAALGGGCGSGYDIARDLHPRALPDWYNAHDPGDREFRVVGGGPRQVTNDTATPQRTFVNVNRASRNLVEAMAARARQEGIHVFTLGLGNLLKQATGPYAAPDDTGENLLKCMANTPDAPARCRAAGAGQPAGVYCHAATTADLQPCFALLGAEILRITR